MDYDTFNNHSEDRTEEEYFAYVDWLSEQTAAALSEAKGDPEAQKQALCRYYKRGERANLTPGELIDFLGVSTPSILDDAGYDEAEADALMQISDNLTDEEINGVTL
jgi:hypothetical protein